MWKHAHSFISTFCFHWVMRTFFFCFFLPFPRLTVSLFSCDLWPWNKLDTLKQVNSLSVCLSLPTAPCPFRGVKVKSGKVSKIWTFSHSLRWLNRISATLAEGLGKLWVSGVKHLQWMDSWYSQSPENEPNDFSDHSCIVLPQFSLPYTVCLDGLVHSLTIIYYICTILYLIYLPKHFAPVSHKNKV